MKLSQLLKSIASQETEVLQDFELSGLYYDSRKVLPNGGFFAIKGQTSDGHDFIDQALDRGARFIVSERPVGLPQGVFGLVVPSARLSLAQASAEFYGHPCGEMLVIGITGTNGKTTISYLLESILRQGGRNPAVLGTVDYRLGSYVLPSSHTTPESVDLMAMVADFRARGADALIMEVSSHALDQCRVDGLDFDLALFTNLTPEHLDYHGDMESYFCSKARLFGPLLARKKGQSVINRDDPWGARLAEQIPDAWCYGTEEGLRVRPRSFSMSLEGIEASVETPEGVLQLRSGLVGEYNLYNILCALGAGLALGFEPSVLESGINLAPQVPGRMERIANDRGACILVDYAHTGDALDKALRAVEQAQPGRILTIFGCGGDRDRTKRPVMGESAARHSTLSILTSDNPRSEDPARILEDVKPGLLSVFEKEWTLEEARVQLASNADARGFITLEDRRQAIEAAVSLLRSDDLLLVAGKGHEDYQVLSSGKIHFDDREELRRALGLKEDQR